MKGLMAWKNPRLPIWTGSFEGNTSICYVTMHTEYSVFSSSTEATLCLSWEQKACGNAHASPSAITCSLNTNYAKQFFFLSVGINTLSPSPLPISFMFVTFTQLDLTGHCLFQQRQPQPSSPSPPALLLSHLGVAWQEYCRACKNTHYVSFLN